MNVRNGGHVGGLLVWAASAIVFAGDLRGAEPDAKRYLIIHADDAGMSHSVNRATRDAMDRGLVTSASIMVPCPWFSEFAEYAREHPEKDFGIHLTLNAEWRHYRWPPIAGPTKVPSLVDEHGFLWDNVAQVVAHATVEDAEVELRAQIEKAQKFGIKISHLDPHMGAALSRPDLAKLYLRLGVEYNLPVLFVRPTPENRLAERYPEAIRLLPMLEQEGLPILDALYQFYSKGTFEERKRIYLETLRGLPAGTSEIIIHCGYDDAELRAITSSVTIRDSDRRIFMDPEVRAEIEALGIELTTWRETHARGQAQR